MTDNGNIIILLKIYVYVLTAIDSETFHIGRTLKLMKHSIIPLKCIAPNNYIIYVHLRTNHYVHIL